MEDVKRINQDYNGNGLEYDGNVIIFGNLTSIGDVAVTGILSATGDIAVDGNCKAGEIQCAGNISVSGRLECGPVSYVKSFKVGFGKTKLAGDN